ncbi:unnamed protein product [Rotaria magnacalcarata]|uniref:Limiting CO2-inducible protein B/C beta carbonyic anhydrase domain-containing protein n=1 Tax=Rotaria magnacalcarata TaxID=392030 RepID=A0A819XFY1_9BILA|nr:unnamed protein product [Rotaria magnacalcarata]
MGYSASRAATSFPSNPLARSSPNKSRSDTICPHCNQPIKEIKYSDDAFHTSLQKLFLGALGLEEFVFETKQTLVPKEEVEAMWGRAFICGSLGGMLFCGKTGFSAAHHHAPITGPFIYYCFTHIGIDHEGIIGSVYRARSGMEEKTTACGALAAFVAEIASNKLNLNFDEDDIEMSTLKKHIINKTGLSTDVMNAPDLLKVTMAAYETITFDLEKHVRRDAEKFKDRRYALFTGIQIHGPDGSDYCWLGKASLLINGVLSPLTLSKHASLLPLIGSTLMPH